MPRSRLDGPIKPYSTTFAEEAIQKVGTGKFFKKVKSGRVVGNSDPARIDKKSHKARSHEPHRVFSAMLALKYFCAIARIA
jgi:hypothetical protein